jgi:hypothetical protein
MAVAAAASLAACRQPAPQSPFGEDRLARMSARQKVAQLIMARAPSAVLAPAPGDSSRARLLRWTREGLGAVELPSGDAKAVTALADSLRATPLPPLLAVRGERGLADAARGATELPSADGMALLGDADLAGEVGAALAGEAKAIGANLVLAGGPALPADSAGLVPRCRPKGRRRTPPGSARWRRAARRRPSSRSAPHRSTRRRQ